MRSSILSLGLACALGLSLPGAAEEAAPQATSPSGAQPEAAPTAPAPAEAAPQAAPAQAAAPAEAAPQAAEAAPAEGTPAEGAPAEEKPEVHPVAAKEAAAKHTVVLGPVVTDEKGRQGRIHEVKSGDTLWDISDAYLGTPWVWPSLWKSNEEIENPHRIFPGNKLFVSPSEMRLLSEEEAARMLAGGQAPAALADGLGTGAAVPRTYRYTPIETSGFVSVEALRGASAIVDSTVDRVWLGDHDSVIIGLGEGQVQVGDRFDIFRTTSAVSDPDDGRPVGWATLALGWLEVKEVHGETAVAMIESSRGEIRRGDRVLPRVQAGPDIAVGAKPEIVGSVVYTWADRIEMGGDDVVYLNRGSDAGLQVGSPLEVFRPLGTEVDDAQEQVKQLPDHVIARMLVVSTTPDTATAVVTHSASEIEVGDHFRGSDTIWY
jgi:hypothetical protein